MSWDDPKEPSPSRLMMTVLPSRPLDLGPPIPAPTTVTADSATTSTHTVPITEQTPTSSSFREAYCCAHHVPSTPAEAHLFASRTNIRHGVCSVCAPLIASNVVCYYAKQALCAASAIVTDADSEGTESFELACLGIAVKTSSLAAHDARMKQCKFRRILALEDEHHDRSHKGKSVSWGAVKHEDNEPQPIHPPPEWDDSAVTFVSYHQRDDLLDTSGATVSYCHFHHWDQDEHKKVDECICLTCPDLTNQPTRKKERVSYTPDVAYNNTIRIGLPPLPQAQYPSSSSPSPASINASVSSASLAAALLVAALGFTSPDSTYYQYLDIDECVHLLPMASEIPCSFSFDEMVTRYAPHANMCAACVRLVSAKRAYYAARQAEYEMRRIDSHNANNCDENKSSCGDSSNESNSNSKSDSSHDGGSSNGIMEDGLGMESLRVTLAYAEALVEERKKVWKVEIEKDV